MAEGQSSSGSKNWFSRHKILTGILGLVVILIIGNIIGGNSGNNGGSGQITNEAQKEYKIGDTVTVGHFSYKVAAVQDKATVGSQYANSSADGVYKIVSLVVRNNDKEARYADSNMFKLVDDQNREFGTSTEATTSYSISQGGKSDFFLKQINPSIEVGGVLIFDVPKDAKGFKLEVSGSFGSSDKAYITL